MSGRSVPPGSMILTPTDAKILCQAARIGDLRTKYRLGDSTIFSLLTDIAFTALADAASGTVPRQDAASEERGQWTTADLARATGRAERTVRNDCATGALPAQRSTAGWIIQPTDAETYQAAHRHP